MSEFWFHFGGGGFLFSPCITMGLPKVNGEGEGRKEGEDGSLFGFPSRLLEETESGVCVCVFVCSLSLSPFSFPLLRPSPHPPPSKRSRC